MNEEIYCALCGVPFDVWANLYRNGSVKDEDVEWTKYFIALRKAEASGAAGKVVWFLSGVGETDSSTSFESHVPPPDYDARSQKTGKNDAADSSSFSRASAYCKGSDNEEVMYPMHPACWQIFLQVHASLSPQNPLNPDLKKLGQTFSHSERAESKRGLVPEWAGDYAGPEQFWEDGWTWSDDLDASVVAGLLEERPEWDFLAFNPDNLKGFDQLMPDPPLSPSSTTSHVLFRPGLGGPDIFSRLPEELLAEIVSFLPTISAQSVRLASRTMASIHLCTKFWRSRFAYPNELCHIRLPTELLRGSQIVTSSIDWRELYDRLLHPEPSDEYRWWQNRKRIVSLNSKLVQMILSEDSAAQTELESSHDLVCPYLIACPDQNIANTVSALLPTSTTYTISTTFRPGKRTQFLTGIAFIGASSTQGLGFNGPESAESTIITSSEHLRGFEVALAAEGIVGLTAIIRKNDGTNREKPFGARGGKVGHGLLLPAEDGSILGMNISLARNRRIVAMGLLEKQNPVSRLSQDLLSRSLWYPDLPPSDMISTPVIGQSRRETRFSYRCHTTLGISMEAAAYLEQIDAHIDTESHIHGFRLRFKDRDPTPKDWIPGKAIPYLIDGPGGERIHGMEVLWSDETQVSGINLITNRRFANFTTALITSNDLHIEQCKIKDKGSIAGIFGETEVTEGRQGPYRNFGLLCISDRSYDDWESSRSTLVEDKREFDDYMNLCVSHFRPKSAFRLGELNGTQPNHGFINILDFKKSIKSITACLGSRKSGLAPFSSSLVGLKIEYRQSPSPASLLGRCEKLGPSFYMNEDDRIIKVELRFMATDSMKEATTIKEVVFTTQQGMIKGFRGNVVIDSGSQGDHQVVLGSSSCLELIGLAWSFDLRGDLAADHGIQAVYARPQAPEGSHSELISIQKVLYPSFVGIHDLPPFIQPRPIPAKEGKVYPIIPLLLHSPCHISSIRVFFNNFLQGFTFTLSSGETQSVGNLLGPYEDFAIGENQYIYSISIFQRYQNDIRTQRPGDVLAVEAIRFSVVKWIDGKAYTRHSPRCGASKSFGPFMNEQRGLWGDNWGGSANWDGCFPLRETRIDIQPGTSFAGVYVESSNTHVRGMGILVSDQDGLPEDVRPLFARPLKNATAPIKDTSPEKSLTRKDRDKAPYLGMSPPSTFLPLRIFGCKEGTYRTWCPAPASISKVIIYRHQTWGRVVVIGLEFVSRDESVKNTLLGHRTLWMEYAIEINIREGEEVVGFALDGQYGEGQGFEGVKLITGVIDGTKKTVGFYAYVAEFIEGIGILQEGV